MKRAPAPTCLAELVERANMLAGLSIRELAHVLDAPLPPSTVKGKGFFGQLLEAALGAYAFSLPSADFPELGVELKTLPIGSNEMPAESTFVSTIPLNTIGSLRFEESIVYQKLSRVLWIPVYVSDETAYADRKIGESILWQPSAAQLAVLRSDWEETAEIIARGQWYKLNARRGQILQVRPKGANAKALVNVLDEHGLPTQTLPRGFYLRASFTKLIYMRTE